MHTARYDAIVLAGRRGGSDAFGDHAAHRALVDVEGEPMLQRVVTVLRDHSRIDRVCVSIDAPELLDQVEPLGTWIRAGEVEVLRAASSPSRSALEALDALRKGDADAGPTLLTTADHALLDAEILDAFLDGAERTSCDVAAGCVPESVLRRAYPESRRTYLRFRDNAVSGANLFAFRTPRARQAAEFWQRLEHLRKQPWRLASAFGLGTLLAYAFRRLTLSTAIERASDAIGVRCAAIELPIAEAAIDVDRPADLKLVEQILRTRREADGGRAREPRQAPERTGPALP